MAQTWIPKRNTTEPFPMLTKFSIFVHNLPPRSSFMWAEDFFGKVDNLHSLYLPPNPDKNGKFYAVVSYRHRKDIKDAIDRFNGTIVRGYYSLSVTKAVSAEKSISDMEFQKDMDELKQKWLRKRKDNRISFQKTLQGGVLGVCHNNAGADAILKEMIDEGLLDVKMNIQCLGNRVFSISSLGEGEHKIKRSWLEKWFSICLESHDLLNNGGMFRWVSIEGIVPISGCSKENVTAIADVFGEVIMIHGASIGEGNIGRAYALIHTEHFEPMDEDVIFFIQECCYTIFVRDVDSGSVPVVTEAVQGSEECANVSADDEESVTLGEALGPKGSPPSFVPTRDPREKARQTLEFFKEFGFKVNGSDEDIIQHLVKDMEGTPRDDPRS